jgi:acyl-CoA thioester hydrolase
MTILLSKQQINTMPSAKIIFDYETFNESGDLLNTGEVVLVFVNKDSGKPCFAPEVVMNKLKVKFV